MDVNFNSQVAVVNACLPSMIKRKSGHIVNILSLTGILGVPLKSIYSATKHGMSGFGGVLRTEVKRHGVNVTQVYPGFL